MIELTLIPAEAGTRGQRYDAVLPSGLVICTSRQPVYDGARALLAAGVDPDETMQATHAGSAIVAMRAKVGDAARWTIHETAGGRTSRQEWAPFVRGPGAEADADEESYSGPMEIAARPREMAIAAIG